MFNSPQAARADRRGQRAIDGRHARRTFRTRLRRPTRGCVAFRLPCGPDSRDGVGASGEQWAGWALGEVTRPLFKREARQKKRNSTGDRRLTR